LTSRPHPPKNPGTKGVAKAISWTNGRSPQSIRHRRMAAEIHTDPTYLRINAADRFYEFRRESANGFSGNGGDPQGIRLRHRVCRQPASAASTLG
jgi:hypothetical protein